ncbi:PEP-CTERM sorting domain-containing protein [candidate division GN15 bacterium]|nr:PEP-CTERM sorting domain-containing protein [candidate division GN15 bacterium]
MKTPVNRLLLIAAVGVLALGMVGSANAQAFMMQESIHEDYFFLGDFHTYDYASSVDFYTDSPDGILGGAWLGNGYGMDNTMSWGHTLPNGLNVPPDVIDRARLWIDAEWVSSDGNTVAIEGTMDWDPLNNWFTDNTSYDLANVEAPNFWNDGMLNVTVTADEWSLRIDQAVLMMDWTDVDGSGAPVTSMPEPTSMALFALGLVGAGVVRRKMKR